MADYYDALLAAMAGAILAGAAASVHPEVAVYQGVGGGSAFATLLLYESLFRNPPSEPASTEQAGPAVVGTGWLLALVAFI